jgi:hypothetical protein
MQFKHPEILYVLFALLIPVFIHLFQLQRFTKTLFTNVKFLKEIELQTRKSSRLKKWLILISRLGIFASLIIAFAQPYFSKNAITKQWMTSIYLDNSLSMQAKGNQGELLKRTVQNIAKYIPDNGTYNLLTNDSFDKDLTKQILLEKLKKIDYSAQTNSFKTVWLKLQDEFNAHPDKHQKVLLLSDFQNTTNKQSQDDFDNLIKEEPNFECIKLKTQHKFNVSIDTIQIISTDIDAVILDVQVSHRGEKTNTISLTAYENDIVLAKNAFDLEKNETKKIRIQLPKKLKNVLFKIDIEDAFLFDNTYYISLFQPKKINVLLVGQKGSFLERIYTKDEFNQNNISQKQLSFELIDQQQLIVFDGIDKISENIGKKIARFVKKGGSIAVIPGVNTKLENLNLFFNQLKIGQLKSYHKDSLQVTKIHFSHPIVNNVFDKKVTNFQYPKVNAYYQNSFTNEKPILSFENQTAFISEITKGKGKIYWVASSLDQKTSDFTKAPLVVPVFYNIAKYSFPQEKLSYRIGEQNTIIIKQNLNKDEVLQIENKISSFIPRQEIQTDKVILQTKAQPIKSGFYTLTKEGETLKNIAFNNTKAESSFSFYDIKNLQKHTSIKQALSQLKADQSIQTFFKWFVMLALLFILIEILLIKYF